MNLFSHLTNNSIKFVIFRNAILRIAKKSGFIINWLQISEIEEFPKKKKNINLSKFLYTK